jgi:CubicO group peptidase (beta-lactamase class C family)
MKSHDHTGSPRDLAEQLQLVAARTKGHRTPALSYAVATPTGSTIAGGVGFADLQQRRIVTAADQFPWFSMTKIATATALVVLGNRGAVDLDAPIDTYLPNYVSGKHGSPTVRHLLTHTAGLGNPLPVRWIRPVGQPPDTELVAGILRKHGRPRRSPGGRAAYSNINYLLAGRIIEEATRNSVEDAIIDLVLRPLAMTDTHYDYDPDRPAATGYIRAPRVLAPALRRLLPRWVVGDRVDGYTILRPFLVEGAAYGGLVGTASDAVRLASAHLTARSTPLGDLSSMRDITCPGKPFDHGVGWFRRPADADRTPPFVEHYGTGGGFWNAMRIYPTLGIAVVGLTNNTSTWPYDDFCGSVVQVLDVGGRAGPGTNAW